MTGLELDAFAARSSADRFWGKVDKGDGSGCWIWTGCKNEKGYGLFGLGGVSRKAHRISFFLTNGEWPLNALHSCDNPSCVNPAHLRSGTAKENMADLLSRGRSSGWRLTAEDVTELRRRFAAGERIASIARSVGRPDTTVRAAIHGRKWAHVPGAIPIKRAA